MTAETDMSGTICIQRRQIVQDLLRRYTVFIDGVSVGKLATFRTGHYSVAAGRHSVQLRIVRTGNSRSDDLTIAVASGRHEWCGLRRWD